MRRLSANTTLTAAAALSLGILLLLLTAQAQQPQSSSETWRFDRLDHLGPHATKIIGHPILIDDPALGGAKAVLFNGIDDALLVDANPLAGAQTFTWEIIFRPDPGGDPAQRFFHLQEQSPTTGQDTDARSLFELRTTNGRWCLEGVSFSSATNNKVLIDRDKLHRQGRWYAAALVYDGRELRTYVNGVLEQSGPVQLTPSGPAGHSSVGARINLRSYFKGAVYLARMTRNAALPPSELLAVPQFREHTIATGLEGGYQVIAADLNHDGKPDLIALSSRANQLIWYENPTWEPHVLANNVSRMINCVAIGADAEGIPDIVLASQFDNLPKKSAGLVTLLQHDGDPRRPWKSREIDQIPSSHRLRLAYIDGSGHPVVINSALAGANADAPDFRDHTPLVLYRPGIWKRESITPENLGLVHGIYIDDWDRDGQDEILTAGFEGVQLFKLGPDSLHWTKTQLTPGAPEPWPKSGASDVAVGRLGSTTRFLATIEPWHGNQVAIYTQTDSTTWKRQVIDTTLADGHTIQTADLDGNGHDVVIAGYRGGAAHNVYLYRYHPESQTWQRSILDNGNMAAASCGVADLNGDGRLDVFCIGSATANLKWYENLGR